MSYAAYERGEGTRVRLVGADFRAGPVRLTRAATVVLDEDVEFDARPPLPQPSGPNARGWIFAISIEASDVKLDLRGHTLSQSRRQRLDSRFFALVLIGSAFFTERTQGPFDMHGSERFSRVCITNGTLGFSSHFAIFSPSCHHVSISDLRCRNFEVAAIQLNNCNGVRISRCEIGPSVSPAQLAPSFTHLQLIVPQLEAHFANEYRFEVAPVWRESEYVV